VLGDAGPRAPGDVSMCVPGDMRVPGDTGMSTVPPTTCAQGAPTRGLAPRGWGLRARGVPAPRDAGAAVVSVVRLDKGSFAGARLPRYEALRGEKPPDLETTVILPDSVFRAPEGRRESGGRGGLRGWGDPSTSGGWRGWGPWDGAGGVGGTPIWPWGWCDWRPQQGAGRVGDPVASMGLAGLEGPLFGHGAGKVGDPGMGLAELGGPLFGCGAVVTGDPGMGLAGLGTPGWGWRGREDPGAAVGLAQMWGWQGWGPQNGTGKDGGAQRGHGAGRAGDPGMRLAELGTPMWQGGWQSWGDPRLAMGLV